MIQSKQLFSSFWIGFVLLLSCNRGDIYPSGTVLCLNQTAIVLIEGEESIIQASVLGKYLEGESVVWHSSNPFVASIDEIGTVRAVSEGSAIITASIRGLEAQVVVHVNRMNSFWLSGYSQAYSDMTWVGNRLIGFGSSPDDLSSSAALYVNVYKDGDISEQPQLLRLFHKWGHCNTVDYNPKTDCLILGNGSGDYSLPGKVIIIPNFSSIVNVTESNANVMSLESVKALVIDCKEYNFGTKFNIVWGEEGNNKEDYIYLISANPANKGDMQRIRRIGLCKQGIGDFGVPQINHTPYNGTFNVLETYSLYTDGYINCNQGTCFYENELIAAVGHDGLWYWRIRFEDSGIIKTTYKQKRIGSDNAGNASGICIKDGFLFLGSANQGIWVMKL